MSTDFHKQNPYTYKEHRMHFIANILKTQKNVPR